MPTPYTPDPTAAQAPSPVPEPENYPILNIPIATEGRTVSSIEQFAKALGDHLVWLKRPTAKALAWAQHILSFRSALGHRRFSIDHLGLPGGLVFSKDFIGQLNSTIGLSEWYSEVIGAGNKQIATMPEWRYKGTQAAGGFTAGGATNRDGNGGGPAFYVQSGDSGDDYAHLSSGVYGDFSTHKHVVLDTTAVQHIAFNNQEALIGLGEIPNNGGSDADQNPGNIQNFIGFWFDGVNWHAFTANAGVATDVDTTVAAATGVAAVPDRLRVEWHGSGVSEDGNSMARFYVNGVLRSEIATNLPVVGTNIYLILAIRTRTGGGGGGVIQTGPMRFRMNMFSSDITQ